MNFINVVDGDISTGGKGENLLVYLSPIDSEPMRERLGREKIDYESDELVVTRGKRFKDRDGNSTTGYRYLIKDKSGDFIAAVNVTKRNRTSIVSNIYVRPDHRRKGLATRLINEVRRDHKNLFVDKTMTTDGYAFFVREIPDKANKTHKHRPN